jgi:hypothetical protein
MVLVTWWLADIRNTNILFVQINILCDYKLHNSLFYTSTRKLPAIRKHATCFIYSSDLMTLYIILIENYIIIIIRILLLCLIKWKIKLNTIPWQFCLPFRSSPPVSSGVRVGLSLIICVVFVDRCLSFLFRPLCCLSFLDWRILITFNRKLYNNNYTNLTFMSYKMKNKAKYHTAGT